jgi:inosine-uridine nucleoside N-ribohydrolase
LPQKLLIDADPGIGDALAVALAILDPEVELVAVTGVAGCVSGEVACRNILTVVSHLDPPHWPRFGHGEGPRKMGKGDKHFPSPQLLHGVQGLGDCPAVDVDHHQKHDSAKVLIECVKAFPNECVLLTLGPLTNVHRAIELYPEFLQHLKHLVCFGGSLTAQGDLQAAVEFNIGADPEAARVVLTSIAAKTLLPLEVSRQMTLSFEQYQRLPSGGAFRKLLELMIPYGLRASRQHLGLEGLLLPEVVALAAVTNPRLFEREDGIIDVELHGELTRGMTVIDHRRASLRESNISLLTATEPQAILDYMTRLLRRSSEF